MATRMKTSGGASSGDVVAGNLRALKAMRRLTDEQLAARMGVKRSWVQERLSGTRELRLSDLDLFAEAFGVPVARLWYAPWDSNPEPSDSEVAA